jgi:hypothetical protein
MDGTKARSKQDAAEWNAVTPTLRKGREGWGTQYFEVDDENTHRKGGPPAIPSDDPITMHSYFNFFISRAMAKALIQSNNNLYRNAGGIQGVKMAIFFGGLVNPLQWLTHPYF